MHLAATLTTAGLCGLLYFVLSVRVVQVRGALKVSLGDGGNDSLLTRIRAHANFAEYAPLVLVLLAVIELSIDGNPWLWVIGVTFVLARLVHADWHGARRRQPVPRRRHDRHLGTDGRGERLGAAARGGCLKRRSVRSPGSPRHGMSPADDDALRSHAAVRSARRRSRRR